MVIELVALVGESNGDGGLGCRSRFNAIDDNHRRNNTRHDNTVPHPTRTTATD